MTSENGAEVGAGAEHAFPSQRGVAAVLEGIGHLGRIERTNPSRVNESLLEIAQVMSTVAKAIRRGGITRGQLADVRRRVSVLERTAAA